MSRRDWGVIGTAWFWVGVVIVCAAFWAGVGWLVHEAIAASEPKPDPAPRVHHPKPDKFKPHCVYSGVKRFKGGAISSARCTTSPR